MSGIGLSIDCDRIRTISRHLGVCLPMKITSLVCNQFRRARTDGLPIGEGLYGSSGITLSLPSAYQTSDGCNSPARFSFPQSYVEATVRNLTKEGAQDRHEPLLRGLARQLSSLQPHDQLSNIFRHRDGLGETNQSGVAILIAQQSENQPSSPSGLSKV